MGRRTATALGVAALAAAATTGAAAGCGDDPSASDRRQAQVADAAEAAGLPEDVTEFLAEVAAGVDGTYRVAYDVADPSGTTQRLTVTQAPPDRRVEVDRTDGPDTVTIGGEDGAHECRRPADDQPYACEPVAGAGTEGVFGDDQVEALRTALADGAEAYDFAIGEQVVAGVTARCLVATRRPDVDDPALGEEATLCVSPEGAQLLVATPSGTLRAVEYTTAIPPDAFTLPSA